jgi:4-amino-4-deoxy-L-arabinose transferase-like glycosyltransferase
LQRFLLAKRAWLVLLAVVCAVYFYGLGGVPLLGPDEPRYAEVAREMYARGDFVTPTLAGRTWFEKPALLYWLMMTAYRFFGVTEFAARCGSALAGVSTVALVGWVAKRAEFESGEGLRGLGVTAAAVAASCLGLLAFARGASFDIILTAALTASLGFFYASEVERNEGRRRRLLVGFYACVGVSLLAKGLVGVVIPAGVVSLYFLLRRKWPNPLRLGAAWGTLLTLLVAATWYGPVIARHGRVFVEEFFVRQHFARFVSNKYHHPQPVYFYLPVMLMMTLPWTLFLLSGLAGLRETNMRAEDAATKLRVLALAWLAVPLLFFSAAGSKLPGYVLPALPGAALLAGDRVYKYLRGGERLTMRLTGVLTLALCAAGIAFASVYFLPNDPSPHFQMVVSLAALTIPAGVTGLFALFLARRRTLCAVTIVGATLLTVVLVVEFALEPFARRETIGYMMRQANEQGYGELPVVHLHAVERTAEFYAVGRLAYDEHGEPLKLEGPVEVVEFVRRHGGRALVIVPNEYASQLRRDPDIESREVWENTNVALFYVQTTETAPAVQSDERREGR